MASLRNAPARLRNYFKDNYIPQICEALLCGLLVTCPEDPLKYLESMILAIIENGLENLLWDMCIHPSLRPKVRRLSETYLDELFGLDDQLVRYCNSPRYLVDILISVSKASHPLCSIPCNTADGLSLSLATISLPIQSPRQAVTMPEIYISIPWQPSVPATTYSLELKSPHERTHNTITSDPIDKI